MVDKLTAERKALEDQVRVEHAEKEFFLRKLMEANKEVQSSSGMKSTCIAEAGERKYRERDMSLMLFLQLAAPRGM